MTTPKLQKYVIHKFVFAANALEAIKLDSTTPVNEVFVADLISPEQPITNAIGYKTIPEEEDDD